MFMQISVYSIIWYLVSSFILIFFFFRTPVTRVSTAKITQLASLDLHLRDIDACVLLDSKENIVKRVRV